MKVAVIGSRGVSVEDLEEYLPPATSEIVSGGAMGVDDSAAAYAIKARLPLTVFHPDYDSFGKKAPLMRNLEIIRYADLVLAFWDGRSRGTRFVIENCRRMHTPINVFLLEDASSPSRPPFPKEGGEPETDPEGFFSGASGIPSEEGVPAPDSHEEEGDDLPFFAPGDAPGNRKSTENTDGEDSVDDEDACFEDEDGEDGEGGKISLFPWEDEENGPIEDDPSEDSPFFGNDTVLFDEFPLSELLSSPGFPDGDGGAEAASPAADSAETDFPMTDSQKADSPETDLSEMDLLVTDSRETDSLEINSPATDSAEADLSVTDSPEADLPETDSLVMDSPEADSSVTDSPEADLPETDSPVMDSSEPSSSETDSPEASSPMAEIPDEALPTD